MKRTIAVRNEEVGLPEQDGAEKKRAKEEAGDADAVLELTGDDFECVICCDLMVDPVVSKCGHDFCLFCLDMVVDAAHKRHAAPSCPVCRTALARMGASHELSVCIKLKQLIERLFPRRSRQRRTEVEQEQELQKAKTAAETAQRRAARSAAAAAAAAAGGAGMQFGLPRGLLDDLSFSRHMLDMIHRSHQRAYAFAPGAAAPPAGSAAAAAAVAAAGDAAHSLAANAAAAAAAAAAASSASREALQELRQRVSRRVDSLRAAESLAREGGRGAAAGAPAAAAAAAYAGPGSDGLADFLRNVPTGSRSTRGRPDPAAAGAGAAAPTQRARQRLSTAAAAAAAGDRQEGREAPAADEAGAPEPGAAAAAAAAAGQPAANDRYDLVYDLLDMADILPPGRHAAVEALFNPPHRRRLGRDPTAAAAAAAAAAGSAAAAPLDRAAPAEGVPASPPPAAAAAAEAAAGADAPPAAAAAAAGTGAEEARDMVLPSARLGSKPWRNVPRSRLHPAARLTPTGRTATAPDGTVYYQVRASLDAAAAAAAAAVGDWDPAAAAAGAGDTAAAAAAAAAAGAGVSSSPAARLAGLAARHAGSPGSRSIVGPPLFRPAAAAAAAAAADEDEADSGSRQLVAGGGSSAADTQAAGGERMPARGRPFYGIPEFGLGLPADRAGRDPRAADIGSLLPRRARRFGVLRDVQRPQGLGGSGLSGRQGAAAAAVGGDDFLAEAAALFDEADSLLVSSRHNRHRPGQAALSPAAHSILAGAADDIADAVADAAIAAVDNFPAAAAAAGGGGGADGEAPAGAVGAAERQRQRGQPLAGHELRAPVVGEGQDVRQHAAAVAAAAAAAAPQMRLAGLRDAYGAPYAGYVHRSHTHPTAAAAAAEVAAPAAVSLSRHNVLQPPHAVSGARGAPAAAAAAGGGEVAAAGAGQPAPAARADECMGEAPAVADPPAAARAALAAFADAPPAAARAAPAAFAGVRELLGPAARAEAPLAAAAAAGAESSDEATEHLAAPVEWQAPVLPFAGAAAAPEGSVRRPAAAAAAGARGGGGGLSGRQTARRGRMPAGRGPVRRGHLGQPVSSSQQQDRRLGRVGWSPESSDSDNGQQAGRREGGGWGAAGVGPVRRTAQGAAAAGVDAQVTGGAASELAAWARSSSSHRARETASRHRLADRRHGLPGAPAAGARQAAAAPGAAAAPAMVEDGGYISSD